MDKGVINLLFYLVLGLIALVGVLVLVAYLGYLAKGETSGILGIFSHIFSGR
jgi:uncharacterized membrane protein